MMEPAFDKLSHIKRIDKSYMRKHLAGFTGQLQDGLKKDCSPSLPSGYFEVDNIVWAGMGGSAIGGDVLRNYLSVELQIPFFVNRDYKLPAFVNPRGVFFLQY